MVKTISIWAVAIAVFAAGMFVVHQRQKNVSLMSTYLFDERTDAWTLIWNGFRKHEVGPKMKPFHWSCIKTRGDTTLVYMIPLGKQEIAIKSLSYRTDSVPSPGKIMKQLGQYTLLEDTTRIDSNGLRITMKGVQGKLVLHYYPSGEISIHKFNKAK